MARRQGRGGGAEQARQRLIGSDGRDGWARGTYVLLEAASLCLAHGQNLDGHVLRGRRAELLLLLLLLHLLLVLALHLLLVQLLEVHLDLLLELLLHLLLVLLLHLLLELLVRGLHGAGTHLAHGTHGAHGAVLLDGDDDGSAHLIHGDVAAGGPGQGS